MTRRGLIIGGIVGVASLAVLGVGAGVVVNDVSDVTGAFKDPGTNIEGYFRSRYRRCRVGFTVGYPEGYSPGARLPLVIVMHGYRGDHRGAVAGYSPAGAATLANDVRPLAVVTVDGGQGYWHPHPLDDPMSMVMHELIPMMQHRQLGVGTRRVAVMGTSMGGYGALIFAEHFPDTFAGAAAISPAIFATYDWAHHISPSAYWSPGDFARYDAISHAGSLAGQPVRAASGVSDPFHPWVEDFKRALPAPGIVEFPPGAHTTSFFASQTEPSIRFLASHFS